MISTPAKSRDGHTGPPRHRRFPYFEPLARAASASNHRPERKQRRTSPPHLHRCVRDLPPHRRYPPRPENLGGRGNRPNGELAKSARRHGMQTPPATLPGCLPPLPAASTQMITTSRTNHSIGGQVDTTKAVQVLLHAFYVEGADYSTADEVPLSPSSSGLQRETRIGESLSKSLPTGPADLTWEVLVVDDGSSDSHRTSVTDAASGIRGVRPYPSLTEARGTGRVGMQAARYIVPV